ncbi:MAG: 23S rRNA (pseudouridine(1915)-N(3))-methyltransferase RlmH [candidate division KSB1 bacterium]|nr:23S rRNA (pseudouridine(1915)-N(3))-methyltransferase RlmH [candidate division KSB1 bacterium]MDZ7334260.1 23S rRNA (pseudouridine(1915)-N(3))-methyltransferase RlmH [candidate division KSB1 bacterium]MDZ7356342.1 23S rRNA (pseudouridine(1915)-N(3))-methyltransferase RlmH [candidate division KSB1 bacterium]MDZ7375814.1 23S rRNA (pseudouridine(1915)-N(3))-methyltransferase RlmH [candidate division KSB1 bacterium]MDZ7401034.1 23S rRNA (pseudouridine(1915)-N(3))-methyltransferase RlmH [candidat
MKIKIIVVGKTKESFLHEGEQQMLNRLTHYCPVELVVVKAEKLTENINEQVAKCKEAERILDQVRPCDQIIALDERGTQLSSIEFAGFIEKKMNESAAALCFVIGGALGLADTVLKSAKYVLSLSKMTFTHEMIRLIFLEQLYRAFTIIRGTKYHKG